MPLPSAPLALALPHPLPLALELVLLPTERFEAAIERRGDRAISSIKSNCGTAALGVDEAAEEEEEECDEAEGDSGPFGACSVFECDPGMEAL